MKTTTTCIVLLTLLLGIFPTNINAQKIRAQSDRLIKELEDTRVTIGARIWKVYDMGFIVRTKTVTLAFDLVSGATAGCKDFSLSAEELNRLIKQCDVLFISHKHRVLDAVIYPGHQGESVENNVDAYLELTYTNLKNPNILLSL